MNGEGPATVCLLGLGLMGASIGLALKAAGKSPRVRAYARRSETRAEALARGIADEVFHDPAEAARGADLIIACVPVCDIPVLLAAARPGIAAGAMVTDVGSTKAWLGREARAALEGSGAIFVGSHPMCGSERTGLGAATADLYRGAACIVCADADTREAVWRVSRFWTGLGARVVEMEAERHDALAAATSHVPHLAASAIVLATQGHPDVLRDLVGPGFRDTTRVASGSPDLWRDIVQSNAPAILAGLRGLETEVRVLADAIAANDFDQVEKRLADAAARRDILCHRPCATAETPRVIAIDGPSASGKSTVARGVARAIGALYVDSGAIYRGMTWKVLNEGIDVRDEDGIRAVLRDTRWTFAVKEGAIGFAIDGEDPADAIRGEAVREGVSYVARIPEVRVFVGERIRGMRGMGKLVVEGRDIGSVVFPEAKWKFYLDANPEERARRRNAELQATEAGISVEDVLRNLTKRDHLDSTRKTAPLQVAHGAEVIDTTELTLAQVVALIVAKVGA
jgi:prephenate dehydrogenase